MKNDVPVLPPAAQINDVAAQLDPSPPQNTDVEVQVGAQDPPCLPDIAILVTQPSSPPEPEVPAMNLNRMFVEEVQY